MKLSYPYEFTTHTLCTHTHLHFCELSAVWCPAVSVKCVLHFTELLGYGKWMCVLMWHQMAEWRHSWQRTVTFTSWLVYWNSTCANCRNLCSLTHCIPISSLAWVQSAVFCVSVPWCICEMFRSSDPDLLLPSQPYRPRVGSGVVRIDTLRFLAGCRTRRLNQV